MTTVDVLWIFITILFNQGGDASVLRYERPEFCVENEYGREVCEPAAWVQLEDCREARRRMLGSRGHQNGYVLACFQVQYERAYPKEAL